ncbi:unnamed protein product [Lupinus luteus]|uniref:Uncharacterized protein n=1 Tax=Lupinus luteus TaxID=3873 RepID=A0AAV1XID6_LUPLU
MVQVLNQPSFKTDQNRSKAGQYRTKPVKTGKPAGFGENRSVYTYSIFFQNKIQKIKTFPFMVHYTHHFSMTSSIILLQTFIFEQASRVVPHTYFNDKLFIFNQTFTVLFFSLQIVISSAPSMTNLHPPPSIGIIHYFPWILFTILD